jgi:uncharacterized protein
MFYGNPRVRKFGKTLGKTGLVLLSCCFLASCTNSSMTNQSSILSNSASPTPLVAPPVNGSTNGSINSSINGSTPAAIASPLAATPATPATISTPPTRLTAQLDQPTTPQPQALQPRGQATQPPQVLPLTARVIIADQTIDLEVANTPQEQSIGLMFRTELLPNRGMLFPFQPARAVGFWMKNTLIPLDMVFLHQGIIKKIEAQVPPCTADPCPSYGPLFNVDIDQVIELRNGRAAELGLQEGDRLTVEFLP